MSVTSPSRPASRPAVVAGGVLVVLGIAAYAATRAESATALIPSVLGAVFVVLGVLRSRLGRVADIAVAVVAVVGLLGSLRVLPVLPDALRGEADLSGWAVSGQLVTLAVCAVLAGHAVLSLRAGRGER
jgi:hypothetical protein